MIFNQKSESPLKGFLGVKQFPNNGIKNVIGLGQSLHSFDLSKTNVFGSPLPKSLLRGQNMESPLYKLTTPSAAYHNAHLGAPSADVSPMRSSYKNHDPRQDRGIFGGLEDPRFDFNRLTASPNIKLLSKADTGFRPLRPFNGQYPTNIEGIRLVDHQNSHSQLQEPPAISPQKGTSFVENLLKYETPPKKGVSSRFAEDANLQGIMHSLEK